ncbi:hypothetical protein BS47DRAFT_1369998 [Hydnum rufescens UP504]|uniref:Uncharacterized protein n=1 Tax=Hydnum rufescens UP504 TaxID=1448309 RepID=A0A9P6AAS6_9AGAM|nr:hypothetical protein BS47DRAFT_1369998 [Hydnum rufescens UP504]
MTAGIGGFLTKAERMKNILQKINNSEEECATKNGQVQQHGLLQHSSPGAWYGYMQALVWQYKGMNNIMFCLSFAPVDKVISDGYLQKDQCQDMWVELRCSLILSGFINRGMRIQRVRRVDGWVNKLVWKVLYQAEGPRDGSIDGLLKCRKECGQGIIHAFIEELSKMLGSLERASVCFQKGTRRHWKSGYFDSKTKPEMKEMTDFLQ